MDKPDSPLDPDCNLWLSVRAHFESALSFGSCKGFMLFTVTWINFNSRVWGTWRIPKIYLNQAVHEVTFSRALSVSYNIKKFWHFKISLININDVMMSFMSFMNQYSLLLQIVGPGLPAEFLIMSAVFRTWWWNFKCPFACKQHVSFSVFTQRLGLMQMHF